MLPDFLRSMMGRVADDCPNYEDVRPTSNEERSEYLKIKLMGEDLKKAALEHEALKSRFYSSLKLSLKDYRRVQVRPGKKAGEFVVQVHQCEEDH